MKYRSFPNNNDLKVSEVGFGVWSVATKWWGVDDEELAIKLLRYSVDKGINFFDTADVYGNGYGEELLYKAFEKNRKDLIIATKFGYDIYSNSGERKGHKELPQKFSRENIRFSCEQSLKRLKTDYIDIYQMHNPRFDFINNEEVIDTLNELKKEGKIRSWGMALGPDIGWLHEGIASIAQNPGAIQIIYNLLEQEPSKTLLKEPNKNIGFIARVPHASGILDGSFTKEKVYDKDDHRSHRKHQWMHNGLKAKDDLEFLFNDKDRTIGQTAILFSLSEEKICTVLPNFTNHSEIDEYSECSSLEPLSQEEIKTIHKLWDESHCKLLDQPFSDSNTKPTPK